ncbi:Peptide hydrolase [Pleurostoma richardsiae]|uniref:Peptide hydrolase n=1 Tax=Pleurostoma richardsiae TaxID=41990 RepID=A0AA38VJ12_9PEZI|nr:Peptide hydrolase [Pleurostoma richardsiae]
MARRLSLAGQQHHALLPLLVLHLLLVLSASAYKPLSENFLRRVPGVGDDFDINNGKLLAPILIPRVPGTPGQAKAQEHFVNFFRTELPKWTIEWQNSTSKTPATGDKVLPFANLIFRREPPWVKPGQANLLTLVAHYDSKFKPDGFIGAIDSAVPCAVLMHVARSIDRYLTQMHDEMVELGELGGTPPMDMGVQILLLDGEEAFLSWTNTDSLYGSRSLAEEWENTPHPPLSNFHNQLNQISMFVLLDLLGSTNPKIPSYFQTTHWAYRGMANVEERMRKLGLLESTPAEAFLPDAAKLATQFGRGFIQDDHVPFMARGVPILHVIPSSFPHVWHTIDDDGPHLDMPTSRDWAKIVTGFALEWLDMMEVEPTD